MSSSDRFFTRSVKYNPLRVLRLFDLAASAGSGNFLDNDDYEEIIVHDNISSSVDFAIRISGDSMEPVLEDGQIACVKQQQTILPGEIGIFYLDGEAFCKRLQIGEDGLRLESINEKYRPIYIYENSDIRVFGKVIDVLTNEIESE